MIPMILLGMTLVGLLCVLAYRLATYALPFMLGLAVARFAYATGAGLIGAGIVGFVAGTASFGLLRLLFCRLRAPILRGLVALIFVIPAVIAGYQLVNGVTRDVVPSEIWRQIFCGMGGLVVGLSTLARLAPPADIGTGKTNIPHTIW
ncbi:hypothetical protein GALL_244670 [mine drainage metagenome]|uniref:Uncharacterized protein n=1 Tax=mine drainage metagenome TaxID=410659 RepID=A0A1J5RVW5_9ZZZZ